MKYPPQLLTSLNRSIVRVKRINWDLKIQAKVREALDYINTHYTAYPTLVDASFLVGLSPSNLCRKFKQEMGINFCEYIHKVRLQRAVFLLLGSSKRIKEITYEIGYSNPQLFSKTFKRYLGCSPKAYRAQHKKTRPIEQARGRKKKSEIALAVSG